jgi:hypothetical protein
MRGQYQARKVIRSLDAILISSYLDHCVTSSRTTPGDLSWISGGVDMFINVRISKKQHVKCHIGITIFVLMIICLFPSVSRASSPVDLSIGGTAWYAWWKPGWSDSKNVVRMIPVLTGSLQYYIEDSNDFKVKSNVMGGPVVSIGFLGRWNISSVFTIGRFNFTSSGISQSGFLSVLGINLMPQYAKYDRDILKMDSDSTISFSISRYIKIFAGFKYQGYIYKQKLIFTAPPPTPVNFFVRDLTDRVDNYGPGLGLGFNIPLVENLYLQLNVSGILLFGYEDIDVDKSYYLQLGMGGTYIFVIPSRGSFYSYGGASSLSFAYLIDRINTTITLGGRYQLLYYRQNFNYHNIFNNDVAMSIVNNQYEHFWGVTMSAVYTFHIGKGEKTSN